MCACICVATCEREQARDNFAHLHSHSWKFWESFNEVFSVICEPKHRMCLAIYPEFICNSF